MPPANFRTDLAFSHDGNNSSLDFLQRFDPEIQWYPNTVAGNDQGIDFLGLHPDGGIIGVDVKERRPGSKRYWKGGEPDLALEDWSVMPGGKYKTPDDKAKVGWALDYTKAKDRVTYILFKFAPEDHHFAYVYPFPMLRTVFSRYHLEWEKYSTKANDNGKYESRALYIPMTVMDKAWHKTHVIPDIIS